MTEAQPFFSQKKAVQKLWVKWAFWALVAIYAVAIMYRPAFNIIDDHKFLYTVRLGHFVPPFIESERARFSPLLAQEYNLISLVSSSAVTFYAFNVVELFAVAWLLVSIGRMAGTLHPAVPYITAAVILLSPGFAAGWFRLWVQEKNELLLLAAFLLAYLRFREFGNRFVALLCLCGAELALYTKESAFVAIGAVGFLGLLLDRVPRRLDVRQARSWRILHYLLLVSCAVFLGLYFELVYRHRGSHTYGSRPGSWLENHLLATASSLLHEPILIPGLLALASFRLVRGQRAHMAEPYWVLLLTSISLVCAYAALGLSNVYYLLPAYFTLPYLVTAISETQYFAPKFTKRWVVTLFCVLAINQIVVATQQFTIWRVGADDFQAILPHIEAQLHGPQRIRVFLDGTDVGQSGEMFGGLVTYLSADGISATQYDLLTNDSADATSSFYAPWKSEFSYSSGPQIPRTDDLLLVTPADPSAQRQKLTNSKRYMLIFRTQSLTYRNLSIKALLRRGLGLSPGADSVIDPNYELYRTLQSN